MKVEEKYKKINIQTLERREQMQPKEVSKENLVQKMNGFFQWSQHPLLCYCDTGISQKRVLKQNGLFRVNSFFDAFYYAYTKHGDIVLIPDEIWIMISFYLSTYIDQNAEKLRSKIVSHQGVKTLTILQNASSVKQSLQMQKDWDNFFEQIIKAIEAETAKGVVDSLACDFSTTTKVYKTISTAIIMNSLKKYFQYHRMIAGCGINNVYMAGTRQDWVKMIKKLQNLVKFDVDGALKVYIQHMEIILQNFLSTFDGKPDVTWWNTIMKTPQNRQIYGGNQMEVQGWILHFFGKYKKHVFTGFPEFTIKVPIKMTNLVTNTEKHLLLVSDWVSVSKLNERAYKPDVGMCIFTIREGPNRLESVIKDIQVYRDSKKINYQFVKLNKVEIMAFDEDQKLKRFKSNDKDNKQKGKKLSQFLGNRKKLI